MRLLVVEPGLKLWGSERAFLATLPALVASNERIVVMLPADAELREPLSAFDVDIVTAPIGNLHRTSRLARAAAVAVIVRTCLRYRITKIYLNQAGLCRIVHRVAMVLRVPLAVHVRLVEDIPRCAALPASTPVDLIYISNDMRARHPTDRMAGKRIVTAYDPYVLTSDENGPQDASRVDEAENERMLCCIGRLAAIKGQQQLISAVKLAHNHGLSIGLDLIGVAAPGDPYGVEIEAQAAALIESGQVRLLGYRTDVDELLPNYRYSVIPSLYEPLGRVVMEAWDGGAVPMCSRDAGGCSEIVAASGGGLLYNGHEPEAIAEALLAAEALTESERQALVTRGREWMRRNLSVEAYRNALSGVIFEDRDREGVAHEQALRH